MFFLNVPNITDGPDDTKVIHVKSAYCAAFIPSTYLGINIGTNSGNKKYSKTHIGTNIKTYMNSDFFQNANNECVSLVCPYLVAALG